MAKSKSLFAAACTFGRVGFGKESGSIGVKIPERAMPSDKRQLFISTTLDVVLSLDPDPASATLPGMEEAHDRIAIQVTTKRISVGDSDISLGLTFSKDQLTGEQAKLFAGQGGSLSVLKQVEGISEAAA